MRCFFPTRCVATLAVVVGAGLGLWAQDFPSVVVGDDPGGSELLRVGGATRLNGNVNVSGDAVVRGVFTWGLDAPNKYMYAGSPNKYFAYTDPSCNVLYAGSQGLGFNNSADTVRLAQLTDAGNFGIGCSTAVAAKFHVAGGTISRDPAEWEVLMGNGQVFAGKQIRSPEICVGNLRISYPGTPVCSRLAIGDGTGWRMEWAKQDGTPLGCFRDDGNVGIGTINPDAKLAVNGTIRAKEVRVENAGWGDYVFAPDYKLLSLGEVAQHIAQNRHLPGIPSAAEIEKNGMGVSDMVSKQMVKIEELTLYAIQAKQERDAMATKVDRLEAELAEIRALLRAK